MNWKKHNYIVAVNRQGEISGQITEKELENIPKKKNILVKDIMNKNVVFIQPEEKISKALEIMNKKKTNNYG